MAARKAKVVLKFNLAVLIYFLSLGNFQPLAHSLPNSKAVLEVNSNAILLKFHTPYEVLELAYRGKINLSSARGLDSLRKYFLNHISITDSLNSKWEVIIGDIKSRESTDIAIGKYQEIYVDIVLRPSTAKSLENFVISSDLIIHQIPNQSILVFSQTGLGNDSPSQLGVISIDIPTGKILPLKISLKNYSGWENFNEMFYLGMRHIKEGTDHLLFIFTLLLPSCLVVANKKWSTFGGTKRSLLKLAKILTAFTIGHSITLLVGGFGLNKIPSQLVEVAIAVTILLSAIHAVRPLFYQKEIFIALGFGLIHGLAFSQSLQEFNLTYLNLLANVFAFNLGIEAMQLVIMASTLPLLLLLSNSYKFNYLKNTAAILVSIVAMAWMVQRITGRDNYISQWADTRPFISSTLLLVLGIVSATCFVVQHIVKLKNNQPITP